MATRSFLLVWTLMFMLPGTGSAQSTDSSKLNPQTARYFQHINLAARAIYKNDFTTAASEYKQAFLYKPGPFYVNLKNAILVNSKCRFFDENNKLLELLLSRKTMDSVAFFADFPYRIFSDRNLVLIRNHFKGRHPRKKQDELMEQALRKIYREFERVNFDEVVYYSKNKTARDSANRENARNFIGLCRESGFPSEEMTGIYFDKETTWALALHNLCTSFLKTDQQTSLLSILASALYQGNLHPSLYASIMDYAFENVKHGQKGYNFMNTTVITMNGKVYRPFVYYSDSLMREVNTNRIAVGLDSFHIVQKQVVAARFCPDLTEDCRSLEMAQYSRVDAYPYAFVKWSFDKEKQDLPSYEIHVAKIAAACDCVQKLY